MLKIYTVIVIPNNHSFEGRNDRYPFLSETYTVTGEPC